MIEFQVGAEEVWESNDPTEMLNCLGALQALILVAEPAFAGSAANLALRKLIVLVACGCAELAIDQIPVEYQPHYQRLLTDARKLVNGKTFLKDAALTEFVTTRTVNASIQIPRSNGAFFSAARAINSAISSMTELRQALDAIRHAIDAQANGATTAEYRKFQETVEGLNAFARAGVPTRNLVDTPQVFNSSVLSYVAAKTRRAYAIECSKIIRFLIPTPKLELADKYYQAYRKVEQQKTRKGKHNGKGKGKKEQGKKSKDERT